MDDDEECVWVGAEGLARLVLGRGVCGAGLVTLARMVALGSRVGRAAAGFVVAAEKGRNAGASSSSSSSASSSERGPRLDFGAVKRGRRTKALLWDRGAGVSESEDELLLLEDGSVLVEVGLGGDSWLRRFAVEEASGAW